MLASYAHALAKCVNTLHWDPDARNAHNYAQRAGSGNRGLINWSQDFAISKFFYTTMAVVGSRVETMQDGDITVAVKTDMVLDTETGLVLERKTVLAGNDQGVVAAQKTTIAAIQVLPFIIQFLLYSAKADTYCFFSFQSHITYTAYPTTKR